MDWQRPDPPALPLFIKAAARGRQHELNTLAGLAIGLGATSAWTVNLVAYLPVNIPWDYPVNRVWWINGSTTTSSNAEFGIYTSGGVKIWSSGSVAMGVGGSLQYVTPAVPFILPKGSYYFAWTCDNTTSRAVTYVGTALAGALVGVLEEVTGAFGLPATMAAAVRYTRATGYNACGLTRTATGF